MDGTAEPWGGMQNENFTVGGFTLEFEANVLDCDFARTLPHGKITAWIPVWLVAVLTQIRCIDGIPNSEAVMFSTPSWCTSSTSGVAFCGTRRSPSRSSLLFMVRHFLQDFLEGLGRIGFKLW